MSTPNTTRPAARHAVTGDVLELPTQPSVGAVLRNRNREYTRADGGWSVRDLAAPDTAPDWMPGPVWPALLEWLDGSVLVTAEGEIPIGLPAEPPVGCRVTTDDGEVHEHQVHLDGSGGDQGWTSRDEFFIPWAALLRRHGRVTLTHDEADVLAAQALADRVDGLRHTDHHTTSDRFPIVFRWLARVEWPARGQDDASHFDYGTVVEVPDLVVERGNHKEAPPSDDAPGRVWWTLGRYPDVGPEPFRIGLIDDDDLAAAVRLLLATARKHPDH